jgi:hypothetical protein
MGFELASAMPPPPPHEVRAVADAANRREIRIFMGSTIYFKCNII